MRGLTVALILVLVGVAGCGDSPAPTAVTVTPPGQAAITILVTPANSTPSGNAQFPWAASFTVTIVETAGVGLQLTEIVVELDEPVVFSGNFLGSGRLAAGGNVGVPLSLGLTQNGVVANVLVRGVDDNENAIEGEGRLLVIPAQGP